MLWSLGHAAWAGGGMPWWPIFPLFWVTLAVVGAVVWRRRARRGWHRRMAPVHAEQTLADRFARGEIDEDEYLERVSVLRGTRQ